MKINFHLRICIFVILFNNINLQAQTQQLSDGLPGRFDQNRRNAPKPASSQPVFRSIDGTNNNIAKSKAEWGATNIPLAREIPAEYGATDTKTLYRDWETLNVSSTSSIGANITTSSNIVTGKQIGRAHV